jgi:hypothetical protein
MKYLIDFENSATTADINAYLAANGCQVLATYNLFERVYLVDCAIQPPGAPIVTSVITDDQTVIAPQSYGPNSTVDIDISSEDQWWKTISVEHMDLNLHNVSIPRRGIQSCVYVMDSGINSAHPEFADADITHLYSFNGDNTDYNGHGTAIASVISGTSCGMSSSKLVSVKIFQSGVPTYQSHILAALDAIASHVNSNSNQFSVVNMSWAIPKNEYVESKIRTLINRKIWVVCAAGNSGTQVNNMTPAGMPEAFTIGAFSRDLTPCDFSNTPSAILNTNNNVNYGPVFFWAPGEHIKAAVGNGYDFVAGTSMAAAIASAAVAYNSWMFLKPDGTVPLNLANNPSSVLMMSGSSYGGILNMTSGYENTTNGIAKFNVYKLSEVPGINLPASNLKVIVKSGEKFELQLINPVFTDQIVQIGTLPSGIVQNQNFIEGTIHTNDYFVREIPYTVIMRNGLSREHRVFLYVTAPEYTLEMIPEEDRILDLQLLVGECCVNAGPPYYGCTQGAQCLLCTDCGGKPFPQCVNNCLSGPCGDEICP